MKTITLLVILSLLAISTKFIFARTAPLTFDAEMLVPNGKNVDEEPVTVVLENNEVKFVAVKKPAVSKTMAYASIKTAEYAYSKKPRYVTGAVAVLALSVLFLPMMFTKTKKHWLTINGENDFAVLKLKKSNYRMLLPALRSKGVNVLDMGNQNNRNADKEVETEKEVKKSIEE